MKNIHELEIFQTISSAGSSNHASYNILFNRLCIQLALKNMKKISFCFRLSQKSKNKENIEYIFDEYLNEISISIEVTWNEKEVIFPFKKCFTHK